MDNPRVNATSGKCDKCDGETYYRDFLGNSFCEAHLYMEWAVDEDMDQA